MKTTNNIENKIDELADGTLKTLEWKIEYLAVSDGVTLRTGSYCSRPSQPVDRLVFLINGKGEWIEKYPEWIDEVETLKKTEANLHQENWLWVSYDHRGQGESEGPTLYLKHMNRSMKDLLTVLKHYNTLALPYFCFAHSMGGLLAVYSTRHKDFNPDFLITSAPFFALARIPIKPLGLRIVANTVNLLGFGRLHTGAGNFERRPFHKNRLTHDPEIYDRIQCSKFKAASPTFAWIKACFDAQHSLFKKSFLKTFNTPILIFSAGDDRVVDANAHQAWAILTSHYGQAKVICQTIQGSYHEIFGESVIYREQALKQTLLFIQSELS